MENKNAIADKYAFLACAKVRYAKDMDELLSLATDRDYAETTDAIGAAYARYLEQSGEPAEAVTTIDNDWQSMTLFWTESDLNYHLDALRGVILQIVDRRAYTELTKAEIDMLAGLLRGGKIQEARIGMDTYAPHEADELQAKWDRHNA